MKKFLSVVIAAVMLLSCFTVYASAEKSNNGDINEDGKLTLFDVTLYLKSIATRWQGYLSD